MDWFLRKYLENIDFWKLFIVPSIILFFDFFGKLGFRNSVADIGADMALLGVAIFITFIVEDIEKRKDFILLSVVIILILILFWGACLHFLSLKPIHYTFVEDLCSMLMRCSKVDFRVVWSNFFGALVFIIAGIVSSNLLRITSELEAN